MEPDIITTLLNNSGLEKVNISGGFIYFQDPSCIFPVFDSFFNVAWIIALVFIAIMLFGWGVLYIKNGVNINTLFNNAKTVLLVLCIFGLTKPIVDMVYGKNLFSTQCEKKRVSLALVQELLDAREKYLGESDRNTDFEIFTVIDSGVVLPPEMLNEETSDSSNKSSQKSDYSNSSDSTANMRKKNGSKNQDGQSSSGGNNFVSTSNVKSIEYRNNATIYVLISGERISRSGGSVSWQNNNPGNIRKSEFARQNGAVGETDKWAVFPDEETGLRAITKLLQTKNYVNLSIKQAINRWAPSSDGNNPDRYAKNVSQRTGLPITAVIKDLSDNDLMKIARAMQSIEGWKPGVEKRI